MKDFFYSLFPPIYHIADFRRALSQPELGAFDSIVAYYPELFLHAPRFVHTHTSHVVWTSLYTTRENLH